MCVCWVGWEERGVKRGERALGRTLLSASWHQQLANRSCQSTIPTEMSNVSKLPIGSADNLMITYNLNRVWRNIKPVARKLIHYSYCRCGRRTCDGHLLSILRMRGFFFLVLKTLNLNHWEFLIFSEIHLIAVIIVALKIFSGAVLTKFGEFSLNLRDAYWFNFSCENGSNLKINTRFYISAFWRQNMFCLKCGTAN